MSTRLYPFIFLLGGNLGTPGLWHYILHLLLGFIPPSPSPPPLYCMYVPISGNRSGQRSMQHWLIWPGHQAICRVPVMIRRIRSKEHNLSSYLGIFFLSSRSLFTDRVSVPGWIFTGFSSLIRVENCFGRDVGR
jgi:hypothetical protein